MKPTKRKPSEKQIVKILEECAQYFEVFCREENSFGKVGKISDAAPYKKVKNVLKRIKNENN